MKWGLAVALAGLAGAAACGSKHQVAPPPPDTPLDGCTPACGDGQVCRYQTCIATPQGCGAELTCGGDLRCDGATNECLPWGLGPGGDSDLTCHNDAAPGVFAPVEQCAWAGPPAGDAFPAHANVLATPMVATFGAMATPSIVFTAYNFTDQASDACIGGNADHYGVIRVIDGRTCAPQATIATPTVIATAALAIGDLGGADATPEIVAVRSQGGLVAFTASPTGWQVLWQTTSSLGAGFCNWTGPAIHDLDDDGKPEVIFYGAVYNGQTGEALDETLGPNSDSTGVGHIPVVADLDGDGIPELVTGQQLYSWDKATHHWVAKRGLPGALGQVAVGDFGTYPVSGQDDRTRLDGVAEIVLVFQGVVHVFNTAGREVFTASLRGVGGPAGEGGPPVIADFDGDGHAEIGVAGATAYHVFDPDCAMRAGGALPDAASCASRAIDGVLWTSAATGTIPASAAFDFSGTARAEVVYGDRCFTRIYDGKTGRVVASHARTSCTFYEYPVVADSDGDLHAELITASNASCGAACPAIDPMFDGVACVDDHDCSPATHCRTDAGATVGLCRCTQDAECGDGYACRDPSAGPEVAGKVCRAAHPMTALSGVHVLADGADRWVSARPMWNQHAYSVTNIDSTGAVPRTSAWPRNWVVGGLNTFRQNAPIDARATLSRPDLTVRQAKATCVGGTPTVVAEVCNRGALRVPAGVPVAVYASTTPSKLRCEAATLEALAPAGCTTVSCVWAGPGGDGAVVVDDRGDGGGSVRECREDNNTLPVHVACP